MSSVIPGDFLKTGITSGRQQNPEHGTFRNIPEHSGTFRNIPEQGKLSQNK